MGQVLQIRCEKCGNAMPPRGHLKNPQQAIVVLFYCAKCGNKWFMKFEPPAETDEGEADND